MKPRVAKDFESLIAKPRLDSYKGYFQARSLEEAIGLYMWNGELSVCFSTLISIFELALRNQVHRAMSFHYSNGSSLSFHWYDRIWGQLKPKSKSKIDEVRRDGTFSRRNLRNPAPSPDEIVSRMSFGFWPNILGVIDRRANFADKIMPAIFPHHPLNTRPFDWTDNTKLTAAIAFIHELNTFRNRIAHHEPLWKFAALYDTAGGKIYPPSANLGDSLIRLRRILSLLDQAMRALNTSVFADLQSSSWRRKIDFLLSERGVLRYRTYRYCPADQAINPLELQRNFHKIVRANQPIRISRSGSTGLFVPD